MRADPPRCPGPFFASHWVVLCTPGSVSGELAVDPQFAPCSGFLRCNFELSSTSPLIDAATDALASCCNADLAGKARKIGAHVDIGAYENDDLIFRSGFQGP